MWSISRPGKSLQDLSGDTEACVSNEDKYSPEQLAYERVITKTLTHYKIPLEITDTIRTTFKSKLHRMGKFLSGTGGKKRLQQLNEWKESVWEFKVGKAEMNNLLETRKRKLEAQISEEISKREKVESVIPELEAQISEEISKRQKAESVIPELELQICEESSRRKKVERVIPELVKERNKLESEVNVLKDANKFLQKAIGSSRVHSNLKSWEDCSRQQHHNRKKKLAGKIENALSFCEEKRFKPCSVELQNVDTGDTEVLDISTGSFSNKENQASDPASKVYSSLYVKDKYSISDQAFHELSAVVSDMPRSYQVKRVTREINSGFKITRAPNGVLGVQQSLRARVTDLVTYLVQKAATDGKDIPNTIRIKLTGDGTRIARGFSVVNIAFTILEEGAIARSAMGNYVVAILKVCESYEELLAGLEDICEEAKDLNVITINGKVYNTVLYLGGDWKFLATICGIESATSEFACIWCKCPKEKRFDMALEWSFTNLTKGARSVEEITEKAKLPKKSKVRFNCCKKPIFPFIPLHRVVIDNFLRISDVLINLLIRDIRIIDGMERVTSKLPDNSKGKYLVSYKDFLNGPCKIRFNWYIDDDTKKLSYRDLTGPEKIRLLEKINIPVLVPPLDKKEQLQTLWKDFYSLIKDIGKSECENVDELEKSIKSWVVKFTALYQTKDVTPYIHAFAMHVPEFLRMYGNISSYTQQGLEKLK